jgi:hypothetical protein
MLIQIMSDLHLDPGAKSISPRFPGVDLLMAAGDICQRLVESAEALCSDFPGGAPDRPSQTTGIKAR